MLSRMRLKPQTYALTAVTHQRRTLFQRAFMAELFLATIFRYRDAGKFKLHGFVAMPDHVHILLTPAPDQTIERCAQLIKGGFSFSARKYCAGEIWQDSYHAHRVVDHEDFRNQLLYIANNPLRRRFTDFPYVHTHRAYASSLDIPPTFD